MWPGGAMIPALAAAASAGLGGAAEVVEGYRRRGPPIAWPDPDADRRAALRQARAFVAADGQVYPAGPCGYVPRSARFDPARAKVRR